MKISRNTQLMLASIISLIGIFSAAFFMIRSIGSGYRENINNDEFQKLQYQQKEQKYDINKIRLESKNGVDIQILKNGTLIRTNKDGQKTAVLGFGKLNQLLSSYSEDELGQLQGSYGDGGEILYIITIDTDSGNTYVIEIADEGELPDALGDLIEDIEDTSNDVLDPTPFPSSLPTATPTPTNPPPPTPAPIPSSSPTPTPPIFPTPTPSPGSQELPAYMTADPFDCSDYNLARNAVISNIICTPN